MNDTNTPYAQRIQPLRRLYERILNICGKHVAVASIASGDQTMFTGEDTAYPCAYLETIADATEGESKGFETYGVVLNILDLLPANATEIQTIELFDRCKQVLDEIKMYLEQKHVFGTKNVGPAQYLLFTDGDVARVRAEFSVTVEKLITDRPDLSLIFRD
ncbi:hypothetical protein I2I05_08595 [Hymenobacter sp. BT683]|uniref:Uncharacterized protein n=1 Tax=Hymenobacter jeongseonensis TaxID=2791027 RepID=A0ABS0II24_9BACT|nr:hypothetical protein [Hymenobacter jeongseonensis]MBF9237455.1 hypothetical protein [Hymenobacter jeongseonensis]